MLVSPLFGSNKEHTNSSCKYCSSSTGLAIDKHRHYGMVALLIRGLSNSVLRHMGQGGNLVNGDRMWSNCRQMLGSSGDFMIIGFRWGIVILFCRKSIRCFRWMVTMSFRCLILML